MKLDAPFLFEKKVMNGNFNWFLSKFCLRECMRHVCPPLAVEEFYENMKSDESTSKTWNDFSLLTDRSDRDPAVQLMDRLKSIIILRSSNVHWNWFYDRLAKYHLVKNSSVKSKDHTEFWLLNLITNWPRFWKKKNMYELQNRVILIWANDPLLFLWKNIQYQNKPNFLQMPTSTKCRKWNKLFYLFVMLHNKFC